ncbi:hypothetical protein [Allokutzneria oryzae]|uniref:Uncharacterized protein n=1 Tax=Allokutzneria oryzae TaxID=1378989 RepID=A0ABV5ZU01_9PSEU
MLPAEAHERPTRAQQFLGRAGLNDVAVVERDHVIRCGQGGGEVGDHDHRAVGVVAEVGDGLRDRGLVLRTERGAGLVDEHDAPA